MPSPDRRRLAHHDAVMDDGASWTPYPIFYVSPGGRQEVRETLAALPRDLRSRLGLEINAAAAGFGDPHTTAIGRIKDTDPLLWELRLSKDRGQNWRAVAIADEIGGRHVLVILSVFNKKDGMAFPMDEKRLAASRASDWLSDRDRRTALLRTMRAEELAASRARNRAIS